MKKMLLAAAALAALASPVFAQSGRVVTPGYGYGPAAWHTAPFRGGAPGGVYAQSPGIAGQAYGLYRNGQYIGWDPDPAVRLMLLKDAGSEGN